MLAAQKTALTKKSLLDADKISKGRAGKATKSKQAPVNTETSVTSALNQKSGSKVLAALRKAQPEELKHMASQKSLMSKLSKNMDADSLKQCRALLGASSSAKDISGEENQKKNGLSAWLKTGKNWFQSGKDAVSHVVSGGMEFVSNIVDAGKELFSEHIVEPGKEWVSNHIVEPGQEAISSVKDYFQSINVMQEIGEFYRDVPEDLRRSLVSGVYNLGGLIHSKWMGADLEQNRQTNAEVLNRDQSPLKTAAATGGYIENQNASGWSEVAYGSSTMRASGCGVIATYNALNSLNEIGENPSPDVLMEIISEYENNYGAVIGGNFGTTPKAIQRYFQKTGHDAKLTTDFSEDNLKHLDQDYDTFIVVGFIFDKDGAVLSAHYISVTKEEDKSTQHCDEKEKTYTYTVHNNGHSDANPHTLNEAIDSLHADQSWDSFSIIGIDGKLSGTQSGSHSGKTTTTDKTAGGKIENFLKSVFEKKS